MNAYVAEIQNYDRIPKAVLCAIAVSLLSTGGENMEGVEARLVEEWRILHQNGIVAQSPDKYIPKGKMPAKVEEAQ
jgi:hypothetical protein